MSDCIVSFELNSDLESHIAANLHNVPDKQRRTANDVGRMHLMELIWTMSVDSQQQATLVFNGQDMPHVGLTNSGHYEMFSSAG